MGGKMDSVMQRRRSATAVLQLLDHLRDMARKDGHGGMAEALDAAYDQCLRSESAMRANRRMSRNQLAH